MKKINQTTTYVLNDAEFIVLRNGRPLEVGIYIIKYEPSETAGKSKEKD